MKIKFSGDAKQSEWCSIVLPSLISEITDEMWQKTYIARACMQWMVYKAHCKRTEGKKCGKEREITKILRP